MSWSWAEKNADSKILIIDDNIENVTALKRLLVFCGYRNLRTLTEPRLAVSVYKEYQPDLTLLDLIMPYVDGFQILTELQETSFSELLPVIAITGQNDRESRIKALRCGAQDVIGKPLDNEEILLKISHFLEIRSTQNEIQHKNDFLQNKVREKAFALEEMQNELIIRLLRVAEFRDSDTGDHIMRIGQCVYTMAKAAELPQDYAEKLFVASKMHDIGKIAIPDQILLKPGRLNAEEWEIMKNHTVKGAQILSESKSEVMILAEEIALTHHEKWDGSGYPNGLKGEQIPVSGRITAIFDVFDALVSKRVYKEPWPLQCAIDEIKKESGKHFDPNLVTLFLDNLYWLSDFYPYLFTDF